VRRALWPGPQDKELEVSMRKWFVLLLLAVLLCACGPALPAPAPTAAALPSPPPVAPTPWGEPIPAAGDVPLVILGTLIDGTGADPIPDAAIVIQSGYIIAVGPRAQVAIPAGARQIDLPQATLLPGFINTHVHKAFDTEILRAWAQTGVTTVRDLGAPRGTPYFAQRNTWQVSPQLARVVAAGPIVTVPGGYPEGRAFPSLTVTSPEDARQKVNSLIDRGAGVIKIALESTAGPILSPEEAAAIVEAAHQRGIPVSAHITRAADLVRALDAGVDDIAHIAVDIVYDDVVERMVREGVSWVPTLTALKGQGSGNLRRFVAAGGQVAMGNDAGYLEGLEIGMPIRELRWMKAAGMTPMEVIVAATRNAARVCRLDDTLGTLEVGKIADVLVVEGDPLQDLEALTRVLLVVHAGTVIRGPLEP
jgi:imidazolonepropionase-like amidohydrolase